MAKRLPRRRSTSRAELSLRQESIQPAISRPPSFRDFILLWTARASVSCMRFGRFLERVSRALKTIGKAFAFGCVILSAAMAVGFVQASRESAPSAQMLDRGTLLQDLATLRREMFADHSFASASNAALMSFADLGQITAAEKDLLSHGLMRGFADGLFRPKTLVTRGEGIAILARFLSTVGASGATSPSTHRREWSDVHPGHWLFRDLSALRSLDICAVWSESDICPDRLLSLADWASLTSRLRTQGNLPARVPVMAMASEPAALPSATQEKLRQMLTSSSSQESVSPVSTAVMQEPHLPETAMNPTAPETETPVLKPIPIDGFIVDGLTGRRLSQGTLLIGSHSVVLQPDGSFRVPGYRDQILEMTAYCEGYQPLTLKHRVGFKPGPVVFGLKVALTAFEGEILDSESGLPVANARIKVGTRLGTTDADGRFRLIGLAPTWHQIICRAPGYMDSVELIYIKNNEEPRLFRLRPQGESMTALPPRQPTLDIPANRNYSEYLEASE